MSSAPLRSEGIPFEKDRGVNFHSKVVQKLDNQPPDSKVFVVCKETPDF